MTTVLFYIAVTVTFVNSKQALYIGQVSTMRRRRGHNLLTATLKLYTDDKKDSTSTLRTLLLRLVYNAPRANNGSKYQLGTWQMKPVISSACQDDCLAVVVGVGV